MAKTGGRRDYGRVEQAAREAATLGAATGGFTEEQADLIFKTVARECETRDEQHLYLMTCRAHGLSPLKSELYATRRGGKLVFVTAYSVFVSRARSAGFIISGESVSEGDNFLGWDATKLEPLEHIIPAGERGNVLGAYAYATHLETGTRPMGGWWPWAELITDTGKLERKDGFMWRTMPAHMAKRVAWMRVARMIAPDLSSLYGAEEFGRVTPTDEDPDAQQIVKALPEGAPREVIDLTHSGTPVPVERESDGPSRDSEAPENG